MTSTSSIRLFVSFGDKGAVFAGENVECTITFKNVAPVPGLSRTVSAHGHPNSGSLGRSSISGGSMSLPNGLPERRSKNPPLQLSAADKARSNVMSPRLPSGGASRGHRPSLSLSVPGNRRSYSNPTTTRGNSVSSGIPKAMTPMTAVATAQGGKHKHKRSISIMSIGSEGGTAEAQSRSPRVRPAGPPHSRSASVSAQQAKRSPSIGVNGNMPHSATLPRRSQPSMAMHISEDSLNSFSFPSPRRSPGTPRHAATGSFNKAFKFPATPTTPSNGSNQPPTAPPRDPPRSSAISQESFLAPGVTNIDLASPIDSASNSEFEHVPPSRVLNAQIMNEDTPRSSGEFYNLSNSTNETLLSNSDYDPKLRTRPPRPPHSRRQSLLAISTSARAAETLMMGYVQVSGSFTIDGSLVQSSPFDEVKRKGVLGGQMGGGVVGVERSKHDSGFLGGLGWGAFSSSIGSGLTSGIGGLLGGNNMSSIAEMKNIASSRSIPILSTPQSILFVDLKLGPGESRSYSFSFPLPKDIPPSHRGKAIKIAYNVVIGTQRPGKGVQQPKVVEIPFRVFPHVKPNGILHTHDLMSPIVLLHDQSKSVCLDDKPAEQALAKPPKQKKKVQESSLDDFLQYAETLLSSSEKMHSPGARGLLSPSISLSRRSSFIIPEEASSKESIDMAVLSSSMRQGTSQMFEIARNGRRVASLSLARPAYKLGEAIIAVIDFSNAQIPCYHLHATLETHETVDPALALRSASSIHRVTRKVHATHSESCLFAKRVTFVPTIPISGTPEFSTSGISSSWALRLEFITPSLPQRETSDSAIDEELEKAGDLLEQTHKDERGQLFTAVQHVVCDMFDCNIPVKVYANDIGSAASLTPAGGWPV